MNTQGSAGTREKVPAHTWVGPWAASRPLRSVSNAVTFVGPLLVSRTASVQELQFQFLFNDQN